MRKSYYFAYGSNMDSARMDDRVGYIPESCTAKLPGWKFGFQKLQTWTGRYGYASIAPSKDDCVEGILYAVDPEDLLVLDTYECVPTAYIRREVKVLTRKNSAIQAVTYIPVRVESVRLWPSRNYFLHLTRGLPRLTLSYQMKVMNLALEGYVPTYKAKAVKTRKADSSRLTSFKGQKVLAYDDIDDVALDGFVDESAPHESVSRETVTLADGSKYSFERKTQFDKN